MLGGGLHALLSQIAQKKSGEQEDVERVDLVADKIRNHLDKNIFVDISTPPEFSKAQLEDAIRVLGADHVLFGCSYPVKREWLLKGVDHIKSLNIGEKEKELVLGGNAQRLFNIK